MGSFWGERGDRKAAAEEAGEKVFAVEKTSRSLTSKEVRDDKKHRGLWRS